MTKHIRMLIALFGALTAATAVAADDVVEADASFGISTSEIERDSGYARISTNKTSVAFYIDNLSEPTVKEECRLGEMDVCWNVVSGTHGGHSDRYQSVFVVYFLAGSDFGKSYTVSVNLTWPVYDEETGDKIDEISRTESFTLDAISYSFSVACSDGTACYNNVSTLVDNHPADATVTPSGCTRRDLLNLSITSVPVEQNPVNKAGTAMPFARTANPCVLHTPKTYWYGLQHPNDCFFLQYYYRLTLSSDYEAVAVRMETVGWPDENPEMTLFVECVETTPEVYPDGLGRYVLRIKRWSFRRMTDWDTSTDQYSAETEIEERYHERQARGEVGLDCGGEPDLFDMDRVFSRLGNPVSNGYYVFRSAIGESSAVFKMRVLNDLREEVEIEEAESERYWRRDLGIRELKAKNVAGYNAAFKYHCTYGNPAAGQFEYCGPESDIVPREARE